jgi:hypothetical protein
VAQTGQKLRRFPGEDESTDDLREVEGWIGVYTELAEFCEHALAEADGRTREPLESWRSHFDSRLETWRKRRDELRTA